jgi:REG-2-like HAD superfamily hydrolase
MTSVSWWTGVVSSTLKHASELEQKEVKLSNDKIQQLSEALYNRFSGKETYEVFPETEEVLQQVRKEYPETTIGVISNTDERLHTIIEKLDLMKHFDFVITSKQVGYAKPHPNIFQAALKAAEVPAEQSLHVGDNVFKDYEGALNAGMNALFLNRNPANTQSTAVCGYTVGIRDLKELPQWIAKFTKRRPFTPISEHREGHFNHAHI